MVEAVVLTETQTSGVNGGGSTGGSWNARILNTLEGNQPTGGSKWCSLNTINGQITLKAGKYLINASSVGVGVGSHQLRLRNVADNTCLYGMSALSYALVPSNSGTSNLIAYLAIPTGDKTYILEHFYEKTVTNFGKGQSVGASGNSEIYAVVSIQKL